MMKIFKSILNFRMFHPAQWFVERKTRIDPEVLNPPSWRERQIQNQIIDKEYEEVLRAKESHWSDRYDKDFENVKKEVVRVRESCIKVD